MNGRGWSHPLCKSTVIKSTLSTSQQHALPWISAILSSPSFLGCPSPWLTSRPFLETLLTLLGLLLDQVASCGELKLIWNHTHTHTHTHTHACTHTHAHTLLLKISVYSERQMIPVFNFGPRWYYRLMDKWQLSFLRLLLLTSSTENCR